MAISMNRIHPTAVIDPSVILGDGNTIGPYAVILGKVQIGNDNWIGPHAAIGTPAQMRGGIHPATWDGEISNAAIEIGSRNVIREFATVHAGTTDITRIASDCYFMTQAHVPHDAQIEDEVTLSNSAQLGGHTIIQRGANIGLGAVIHQRSLVGIRAMVGMGAVVTKAIPPYAMAYGSPAKVRGGNVIGMQRAGVASDLISKVVEALNASDLNALRQLIPTEMAHFNQAESGQKH
jgi:UDP-N-acetylglucosamine acyltransferase